jgi:exoribonuclease II
MIITTARLIDVLREEHRAHREEVAALREEMRERDARHERLMESLLARFVDVVRSSNPLLVPQQAETGEADLPEPIRDAITRRAKDAKERDQLMEYAVVALAEVEDPADEEAVAGIAGTILRGADLSTW